MIRFGRGFAGALRFGGGDMMECGGIGVLGVMSYMMAYGTGVLDLE